MKMIKPSRDTLTCDKLNNILASVEWGAKFSFGNGSRSDKIGIGSYTIN
jgi:hypothetical protein